MDPAEITRLIQGFQGVEVLEANGDTFFFVGDQPADQRMPFATIVASDAHDRASDRDRPGVFRLNIGISRESYEARFGPPPAGPITAEPVETGHDYTALDVVLPHPIYASLGWVCVLNPSETTFGAVRPLLEEAHGIAAARRARREERER